MEKTPQQLQTAVSQIEGGKTPSESVRVFLSWFGAHRRGYWKVKQIRETLASFGLRTDPDFEYAFIDSHISILPAEEIKNGASEKSNERGSEDDKNDGELPDSYQVAQNSWFLKFLDHNAGTMGKRILLKDWAQTELGPIQYWPDALKLSLSSSLSATESAMAVFWYRPEDQKFYFFFNDCFKPILTGRYALDPLGSPISNVWTKDWPLIEQQFKNVIHNNQSLSIKNSLFFREHEAAHKEAYFQYDLAPIPSEDRDINGVLAVVLEQTDHVLRYAALKLLGF